jgi:hypothetical protein
MSGAEADRLICLVSQKEIGLEVGAFLADRQARGLSPRTISFYQDELRYLADWTEARA